MTREYLRKPAGALLGIAGIGLAVVGFALPTRAGAVDSAVTVSSTATRTFLDADGVAQKVDTRKISMTVSQTTNLRGRQEVGVTWTGAHPTGGLVGDINSGLAATEEYPFVLLECRGVDSTKVSAAQRIRPESCWTQTWAERFQKDNTTGYPAWRSDLYATTKDRSNAVEAPSPRPAACFGAGLAERWVPFVTADGTTYPGGAVGCAGMAPEAANVGGAGIPSNATYGITSANGTGSASFDVWTDDENASLGCSYTVACSLVAVPIIGISCDAFGMKLPDDARPPARYVSAADTNCRKTGSYGAGDLAVAGQQSDLAVSGALWWSASNWRNRLTVPLTFATPASSCDVVSNEKPQTIYGSVLMAEASAQWEPKFCTDSSLFPFVHVQTSDFAARNLLSTGSIDAAFSSRAPDEGFARPVVQAPIALSGFAISYVIDDASGHRYTSLKLDARLLAKLLTESYPANPLVRDNYPALANNPMNITLDPEFQALNPGLPKYTILEAASAIMNLSSASDLIWAVTSYINADPDARAWLDGTPDPWGMTVNPTYKGIDLPVESWPLLDGFTLPQAYIDSGNNPCYTHSPSPYLQLISNPSALLATIVQNVQFSVSNVNIACEGTLDDVSSLRLHVQGRQQPGYRFVLGIASLSAAHRYGLTSAALQTSSTVTSGAQFTDTTGRYFAAPDDAGLSAAAALLQPDDAAKTWALSYDDLRGAHGREAYPGTMPIFADVPTSGLPQATADDLAGLLKYAATKGQHVGLLNGDLPPGYVPLDGPLAPLRGYTLRAADAVAAQDGTVPSLNAPTPSGSTSTAPGGGTTSSGSTGTTSSGTSSGGPGPGGNGGGTVPAGPGGVDGGGPVPVGPGGVPVVPVGGASGGSSSSTSPAASSGGNVVPASSAPTLVARTVGQSSTVAGSALPVLLGLGLLAGTAGGLLRYPQAAPVAVGYARRGARRARTFAKGLRR